MSNKALNIVFVLLLICLNSIKAQQVPFYNHYMVNPFVYNPAYAGLDGDMNAYITRGQRYMGIGTGSINNTFSIEGRFLIPNSGFGIILDHNTAGAMNQLGAKMSYAYHVQIGEEHSLGLGVSGGYLENTLRNDKFNILHEDDPFLYGMRESRPLFNMSAGLVYKNKDLQVAISIPQILGNKVKFSKEKTRGFYSLARHLLLSASYDFRFAAIDEITLRPHALMRIVPGAPAQFDISAQVNYEDLGWFSTTYKSGYALQFNLGFHIFKQLHVGYSYEWVVGSARNYYSGVNHEFLLGYTFKTGKTETRVRTEIKRVEVEVEIEVPDPKVVQENERLRRLLREKESQLQAKENLEKRLREELEKEKQRTKDSIATARTKSEAEDKGEIIKSDGNHTFIEVDGSDTPGGYYVIVGVFSEINNLRRNLNEVRKLYPQAYHIINTKKGNYNYIVIQYTFDWQEALKTLKNYTESTGKRGWVLEYKH